MSIPVLLRELERRRGASELEIATLERDLGQALPEDYRQFLLETDGIEGFVGPVAYLMLWPTAEIRSLNEGYGVGEFLPGLLLLGTDGGDTGYGVMGSEGYVSVPLIGMSVTETVSLGGTLEEVIGRLHWRR